MENTEFRMETDGMDLDPGQIWATQRRGIFVVLRAEPAEWTGEDLDVYGHVNTWLTCRAATDAETALWNRAVDAARARTELRKRLDIPKSWRYQDGQLIPPAESTRRLDSYDDRWEPPARIELDQDDQTIEMDYTEARAALKIA